MIVELCAALSHTVKPYFCQHSSTLVNDRSRCSGQSERSDRRLIDRAVIIITEKTGSS